MAPSRCSGSVYWLSLPSALDCASASASWKRVVSLSCRMGRFRFKPTPGTWGWHPPLSSPAGVLLFPAFARLLVARSGFDPTAALFPALALPERSIGLQEIDDESAGLEGLAPVRARHRHQDDPIARRETADAVHDAGPGDSPARPRLRHDVREAALGHAGVVLERQFGDREFVVEVARDAKEANHRSAAAFVHGVYFVAGVEIGLLDADDVPLRHGISRP